ncbi:dopamine beta-hydroxylase [Strongylocentrotus purpuratus]|uniref:Dopamine beta-hydroxylase n=1 Tax=Strongylocentrotus purpuratus TaxID=7668 RepID=A0A7M7PR90_STRPU|nr:dopamine beta-hydroxylase [Strongylocentrotus purpuratus]
MNKKCIVTATHILLFLQALSSINALPILPEEPEHDVVHDYHYETSFVTPYEEIDELAHLKWSVDYTTSLLRYMLSVPLFDDVTADDAGSRSENFPALSRAGREWLAVGMSPYGASTGADMVTFIRGSNGEVTILDTYTDEYGVLTVDDKQDYKLWNAWIRQPLGEDISDDEDDHRVKRKELVIEYGRQIDTCDDKDYLVERGTTHLLFLRGPGSWPQNDTVESSVAPLHHSLRRVTLLKPERPIPSFPSDTKIIEVTVDDITVPDDDTTYWCKVSKFPDAEVKHHIVKYEVEVTEGNEDLVHHIEVYHCDVDPDVEVSLYQGPCDDRPAGSSSLACSQVIGAWAMGAEAFVYPEEAGIAIGGPTTSSYIMIEIHYNNPARKAGIVDSSGLRFYYTPTLRPFDAGIIELGLVYTPKLSIPPEMDEFILTGHCLPRCTGKGLPRRGIKAFASQLHTHLTGTAVWTKHVRDGIEQPELNRDDHFSSDFQEIRMLPKPVHILPGDTLVTSCRYDTSDKDNVTMGGFSITDEMCVNYVHYYPRSPLEVCKSTISKRILRNFFYWANGHEEDVADDLSDEEIIDGFQRLEWTGETKKVWQEIVHQTNVDMDCFRPAGVPFTGKWNDMEREEIRTHLPQISDECSTTDD